MARRAFFFDIDGTLIDMKHNIMTIPETVRAQIARLQSQGDLCLICSGRVKPMLDEHLLGAGFDGYVLGNGGHVEAFGKTIHVEHMSYETACAMRDVFSDGGVEYMVQTAHHVYVNPAFEELRARYVRMSGRDFFSYDGDEDNALHRTLKIETWAAQEDRAHLTDLLLSALGDSIVVDGNGTARAFEAYSSAVSKAKGVQVVCDKLDVDPANTFAFGDGQNDVEMFRACAVSVAMGNAEDVAKQAASIVCDDIRNDGLAKALAEF